MVVIFFTICIDRSRQRSSHRVITAPAPAELPAISIRSISMTGIIPRVIISCLSRYVPNAPAMIIFSGVLRPAFLRRNSIPEIKAALPSWTDRISFWLIEMADPSWENFSGTRVYCIFPEASFPNPGRFISRLKAPSGLIILWVHNWATVFITPVPHIPLGLSREDFDGLINEQRGTAPGAFVNKRHIYSAWTFDNSRVLGCHGPCSELYSCGTTACCIFDWCLSDRISFLEKRSVNYDKWLSKGQISASSKVIPVSEAFSAKQWVLPTEQVMEILSFQ